MIWFFHVFQFPCLFLLSPSNAIEFIGDSNNYTKNLDHFKTGNTLDQAILP